MKPVASTPVLTDQVRNAIVDAIVDGTLRAGERLAQEDIARRLGVSRQPVSHALEVLKRQGVLVGLGRKGLTVAPMDAQRLRDLYRVRASLDALAAEAAAQRVADGDAPEEEISNLSRLVERFRSGAARAPLSQRVDADVEFHVALYRLSGNPWIEEISEPHWVHFRRCMRAALEDRSLRNEVWPEHAGILEAVLAGDSPTAARLAESHARHAGDKTAAQLTARALPEEDTP